MFSKLDVLLISLHALATLAALLTAWNAQLTGAQKKPAAGRESTEKPAEVNPAADPALAISELANLMTIQRRKCSNGLDVPLTDADWRDFAGNCHANYREKPNITS